MAVAVPSVMSYMNSANKAKYYAASRSVTQKVNVELSKLYAGDSDAKNYAMAVKIAVDQYNKSVTGETYVSDIQFNYINRGHPFSFNISNPIANNQQPTEEAMRPENIKTMVIYYKKSLSSASYTCYCDVYSNKKIWKRTSLRESLTF